MLLKEFRDFLLEQNVLALAVGVIIGGAVGRVVTGIVEDVLMPIIGLMLPADAGWRSLELRIGANAIRYGDLAGRIVDFLITAGVVFAIIRLLLERPAPPAPTQVCPQCLEVVPARARRCRACTSALPTA